MPGARAHFKTYKRRNPNPGGGCLCSPDSHIADCTPPYCVGTHKEQFVARNPFVVIGAGCVARMAEATGMAPVAIEAAPASALIEKALEDHTVGELAAALSAKLRAADVGEPVE